MNLRNATKTFKATAMPLILLGFMCAFTGCNKKTRNVLFNTPKKYQKMGLAVVHLNADSSETADGYEHRIQEDDRISLRFLNNFDISSGVTITRQGGADNGISFAKQAPVPGQC